MNDYGFGIPKAESEEEKAEYGEAYMAWRAIYGGSYPEYLVFSELQRRKLEYGVDFLFQANQMGGRNRLGGAVVDFEFPALRVLARLQGEYWHLSSRQAREHDIVQRLLLESGGWTVIDMLAEEVLNSVSRVVGLLLQMQETQTARRAGKS